MKNLIYQFYNEGLGNLFCKKPIDYLKKNIKSKIIIATLSFIIKLLYTVIILLIAGYVLYKKLPI